MVYVVRYDIRSFEFSSLSESMFCSMTACRGKLYLNGFPGENGHGQTGLRYDPSSNHWDHFPSIPSKLSTIIVNFQGYLYLFGGDGPNVSRYNPDMNLWQEVAPLQ